LGPGGAKTKRRVQILDFLDPSGYCLTKKVRKLWKNLSQRPSASKNGCNKDFLQENFSSLGLGGVKTKHEVKI
jgi:hypothetical protein